jgi:hypothetical protein
MKTKTILILLGLIALNLLNPLKTLAQMRDRNDFFRQGDRQLEEEIRRIQQQQSDTPLLTIKNNQENWQTVLLEEVGFSIWMPLGTLRRDLVEIPTDVGNLNFEIVASSQQNPRCFVGYSQEVADLTETSTELVFQQIIDVLKTQKEVELISDNRIKLDESEVREITLKDPYEKIIMRIYLINQRFYILGVGYDENEDFSATITTFFDSFTTVN